MIGALARSITALVLSRLGSQKLVIFFLAKSSQEDLTIMYELIKPDKAIPVIDRRYSLRRSGTSNKGRLEARYNTFEFNGKMASHIDIAS